MRVYFACSITGGRRDESVYQDIVTALEADGHSVPTSHLATPEVMSLEHVVTPEEVYQRDVDWITDCEALIAEVTTPSHGVGYEIGYALSLSKPVLCCYRLGVKVSKMILGNRDPNLRVQPYSHPAEAVKAVREFLQGVAALKSGPMPTRASEESRLNP